MTEPIQNLVRFLRRDPQPSAIRVFTIAGDEKMVRISGNDSRRWSRCADTIEGLNSAKVECLDKAGHVTRVGELPEDEERAAETKAKRDTFESNIAVVAKLLTAAQRDAANAHKEAYELAFNKMVELVGLAFGRMHALERAHVRALRLNDIGTSESGEEPSEFSQLMNAFITGQMMKAQQAAQASVSPSAARTSNGVKHAPKAKPG